MLADLPYERELIRERVNAGLQASRQRGVQLGRRPVEASAVAGQVRAATLLMADGSIAEEVARAVGWSRATLYRNIRRVERAGASALAHLAPRTVTHWLYSTRHRCTRASSGGHISPQRTRLRPLRPSNGSEWGSPSKMDPCQHRPASG